MISVILDTILITGGCGYVGSHTCIPLLKDNYNLLVIDSLINSFEDAIENIKKIFSKDGIDIKDRIQFIKGDLRNKDWLDKIFGDYRKSNKPIKFIIHFLWSIYNSVKSLEYWDNNTSTVSLLYVMKKNKCFNLVFSSSTYVYKPQFKLIKRKRYS